MLEGVWYSRHALLYALDSDVAVCLVLTIDVYALLETNGTKYLFQNEAFHVV